MVRGSRNFQRWIWRAIGVLVAVCLLSAPVVAENELPIGVADFPPFKFKKHGQIVGSDTEIIEQVFARMGYIPKIEMQPWKRVQAQGIKGEFAAIYTFTKSPEREKAFYFTDPISTVRDVFYKRKSDNITWNTMANLKKYRLGASSGYNYSSMFMNAMKAGVLKVQLITGKTPELQNLEKLVKDRVDLLICEISVCQHFIKTHAPRFDHVDYIDKTIGTVRTFHLGFSRKWPGAEQLVKAFNVELAKFVAEGKRKPIFAKYGVISLLD